MHIKKILPVLLLVLLAFSPVWAEGQQEKEKGVTEIVVTSWRTEDAERMNRVNAVYNEKHPNVKIIFSPVKDTEYDANMRAGLQTGTGADILFLRSFDTGESIYDLGYLADLNDKIPALQDFPKTALNAWSKDDGTIYGVPVAGVTHGVYYHKDIFDKYDLEEPETWSEFLDVCQTLKDNGEIPIAQGGIDEWTLYECVYSGLGANFYGGEEARLKLLAGEAKLTDPNFVDAFEAVDQLVPYFPNGYESLEYVSMQQIFGTGQAAMFIGGSWEIGPFRDLGADDLGWFPPPVKKKGDTRHYCFHVDMGVGINKDSKNFDEALEYLKWVATPEFAQLYMEEVPGFYSYTPGDYDLSDPLTKEMVDVAQESELTIRTVWEELSAKSPTGNALMGEALPMMVRGEFTPKEAAAYVQDGLESWYEPFQD